MYSLRNPSGSSFSVAFLPLGRNYMNQLEIINPQSNLGTIAGNVFFNSKGIKCLRILCSISFNRRFGGNQVSHFKLLELDLNSCRQKATQILKKKIALLYIRFLPQAATGHQSTRVSNSIILKIQHIHVQIV